MGLDSPTKMTADTKLYHAGIGTTGSGGSSSSGCADLDSICSGDSQQNSGAAPN